MGRWDARGGVGWWVTPLTVGLDDVSEAEAVVLIEAQIARVKTWTVSTTDAVRNSARRPGRPNEEVCRFLIRGGSRGAGQDRAGCPGWGVHQRIGSSDLSSVQLIQSWSGDFLQKVPRSPAITFLVAQNEIPRSHLRRRDF